MDPTVALGISILFIIFLINPVPKAAYEKRIKELEDRISNLEDRQN